jgi:hypothetical protein
VNWVARSACDGCVVCRYEDSEVRLIEVQMPAYPPVGDDEKFESADAERCVVCSTCLSTAARTLGLFRSPASDPEVVRLSSAYADAQSQLEEAYREEAELQERVRELQLEVDGR